MMSSRFPRVGIAAKPQLPDAIATVQKLMDVLTQHGCSIAIEKGVAALHPDWQSHGLDAFTLASQSDLLVVVGGDGSLLQIATAAAEHQTPVVGINRGRLGFLTDIHPQDIASRFQSIFDGHYSIEQRFLLSARVPELGVQQQALNDVVLMPGEYARMVEFRIHINEEPVCVMRADGLIVATPTGSTAYSLSAGGPIVHPDLDAFVIVPMLPHTLTHRPLVVGAHHTLRINVVPHSTHPPKLSCDGSKGTLLKAGQTLEIAKAPKGLMLLHPPTYHYFETLREKLLWHR